MRNMWIAIAASGLLGAGPAPGTGRTAEAQAKLDKYLAGRVAGETRSCVKTDKTQNPIAIDDRTMLFRDGPRLWRNELQAGYRCAELGLNRALFTVDKPIQMCAGSKVYIVDMKSSETIGSCVLGDFTLYTKS